MPELGRESPWPGDEAEPQNVLLFAYRRNRRTRCRWHSEAYATDYFPRFYHDGSIFVKRWDNGAAVASVLSLEDARDWAGAHGGVLILPC